MSRRAYIKGDVIRVGGAGTGTVTRVGSGSPIEWMDVRWHGDGDDGCDHAARVWFPEKSAERLTCGHEGCNHVHG